MKKTVIYEWDYETVDTDGDIQDHNHRNSLSEFNASDITDTLVLVRNVFDDVNGLKDRTWAYVKDGKLPEKFKDDDELEGTTVPKKFHKELEKYTITNFIVHPEVIDILKKVRKTYKRVIKEVSNCRDTNEADFILSKNCCRRGLCSSLDNLYDTGVLTNSIRRDMCNSDWMFYFKNIRVPYDAYWCKTPYKGNTIKEKIENLQLRVDIINKVIKNRYKPKK